MYSHAHGDVIHSIVDKQRTNIVEDLFSPCNYKKEKKKSFKGTGGVTDHTHMEFRKILL